MKKTTALIIAISIFAAAPSFANSLSARIARIGTVGMIKRIDVDRLITRFDGAIEKTKQNVNLEIRDRRAPWNGGLARSELSILKTSLPDGAIIDVSVFTLATKSPRAGVKTGETTNLSILTNSSNQDVIDDILETLGVRNVNIKKFTTDGAVEYQAINIQLSLDDMNLTTSRIRLGKLADKINTRTLGLLQQPHLTTTRPMSSQTAR